ncbi:MAG TPA: A/G-specific adenine glycosylase [Thermoanaerobaculia bacterium]|nr:A/G-specific adenine glycosylase [Thermoanaerobaculia bacterium]
MPSDPVSIARKTEQWFRRHRRALPWRETYDSYHVWLSEVMLQQTRMEVVLGYYARFLSRFPTLHALAAAPEEEVLAAWSGLGYYRRARMLREGAIAVVSRFGGKVPARIDQLLTIPGIGRYTAGAIASIAHRKRAPIVDGNVARVLARLFLVREPPLREAWLRAEELVGACRDPRDFNQGLMELGALICKPIHPLCDVCPLRAQCAAFEANAVDEVPVREPRKETRALSIPLYLITDETGRILMRRESGELMKAMFHLPHGNSALLDAPPLEADARRLLGTFRHTVTTRRIEFSLYAAELAHVPREYTWIDPAAMADVPHPSYVRKALRLRGVILNSEDCEGSVPISRRA